MLIVVPFGGLCIARQVKLQDAIKKIDEPLHHFDALFELSKMFGLPASQLPEGGPVSPPGTPAATPVTPDSLPEFTAALKRVDAAIQFMLQHVRPLPRHDCGCLCSQLCVITVLVLCGSRASMMRRCT